MSTVNDIFKDSLYCTAHSFCVVWHYRAAWIIWSARFPVSGEVCFQLLFLLSLFSSFFARFLVCTHSSLSQGLDNLILSFFSGYFHINYNLSRPRCCLFFFILDILFSCDESKLQHRKRERHANIGLCLLAPRCRPHHVNSEFIDVIWSLMDSFQETTSFFFAGTSHNNNSENIKKSWIYLLYGIQLSGQRPSSGSLDSRHITSRASGMRERSWKNGEMELNEFNMKCVSFCDENFNVFSFSA